MLTVTVGDITFHGHTSQGFLIGPGGFKGWEGSPATRRDTSPRPFQHGVFPAPAFKGARLLTLEGYALARSEEEIVQMGVILSGIGQRTERVTVRTDHLTTWADGSLEGAVEFDRVGGRDTAQFALSWLCPDPRKYGEMHEYVSEGESVFAWHNGNTEAWPTFTVTGDFPAGYSIVHPEGRFTVTAPLLEGQTHFIDFRTGRVSREGVALRGAVSEATRWGVKAGRKWTWRIARLSTDDKGGRAVLRVHDTYF